MSTPGELEKYARPRWESTYDLRTYDLHISRICRRGQKIRERILKYAMVLVDGCVKLRVHTGIIIGPISGFNECCHFYSNHIVKAESARQIMYVNVPLGFRLGKVHLLCRGGRG